MARSRGQVAQLKRAAAQPGQPAELGGVQLAWPYFQPVTAVVSGMQAQGGG